MGLVANKRSTGVPAARQTLNDEELVCFYLTDRNNFSKIVFYI